MSISQVLSFVSSDEEFTGFNDLNEEDVKEIFKACDENGLVVESIDCFTAIEEIYCQTHVWNFFCEDYLFPLEGWHWKALEQHLLAFKASVEAQDPKDFLVFNIGVAKSYKSEERVAELNSLVEALKNDPSCQPKDFNKPKNIQTVFMD